MKLTSPVFNNNGYIPAKYTCDGENINPPLAITGATTIAKSLVLIFDDPDSPFGTWTHWTVWNILPETKDIPENSVPQGSIQGITSFGKPGYGGPCPSSGTHRYFFKLFALDTQFDLKPETKVEVLIKELENHILDKTELMGKYSRK